MSSDNLTPNKELNPSSSFDLVLKSLALLLQVWCIAIQDMDVLCSYVNVLKEIIPHKGMVAFPVVSW